MTYPEYFNADDIMVFEYEYNRYLDLQNPHSFTSINAELQLIVSNEEDDYDDNWQEHHSIPIYWRSLDITKVGIIA